MQPSAKSVEVLSGLYYMNPPSPLLSPFFPTELKLLLSSKEGSLWSRGQTYYVAREKSIKLRQALKKTVMKYPEKEIHEKPIALAHWKSPLVYKSCKINRKINMVQGYYWLSVHHHQLD